MKVITYTRKTGHQSTGATPGELRQELQVGEIKFLFLLQVQGQHLAGRQTQCEYVHLRADLEVEKDYKGSLKMT